MEEHYFTTYVRTKTVFQYRLKDLKNYDSVKIYVYELKKLGMNDGPRLYDLKIKGEIAYDDKGFFKALRDGPIDPSLLERTKRRVRVSVPFTPLHMYMRDQLLHVELRAPKKLMSVYFKAFLDLRSTQLNAFFTVDAFSGRVHTPIVNLKADLRRALIFHGSSVVSLDVKQMQPTILAKVLFDHVGDNSFSAAIFNGVDVYVLLQKAAGLISRSDAKKMLFQLIFGKPMDGVGRAFHGDTVWVDWINSYKSNIEPRNPHKEDMHTNLAWLLQFNEVQIMTEIWNQLMMMGVPFLTVHDDILCVVKDRKVVYSVMEEVLAKHFAKFTITVTT